MVQDQNRPETGVSVASSHTQVHEKVAQATADHAVSHIAKDDLEDDWAMDPENARNWSFGKKWTAVSIVRLLFFSLSYVSRVPK